MRRKQFKPEPRACITWRALIALGLLLVVAACVTRQAGMSAAASAEDLREAARRGDLSRVEDLLARGASVDERDDVGVTALMEAARAGRAQVCRCLLAHGAGVNARAHCHGTALMMATLHDRVEAVEVLLQHGADPNIRSDINSTPLLMAVLQEDARIVQLLLQAGADPEAQTDAHEPLTKIARECGHAEIAAIVQESIDAKQFKRARR